MKNKMTYTTVILLGLIFSSITVSVYAEEAKILDFGEYVGRLYSDGSGSIGKRLNEEKSGNCKYFDCTYNLEENNKIKNATIKDVWSFSIKNDEMTDEQIITVKRFPHTITKEFGELELRSNVYLWLDLSKRNKEILCVAGHDYPGTRGMIRIDKNTPIKTNKNGCLILSRKLDKQMKSGNKLIIRGYHWPYDGAETHDISLGGYVEMIDFIRKKRLK